MGILRKSITTIYKIFFLGLMLQFFVQTLVTHGLGVQYDRLTYIWLRKEILIGVLGVITAITIAVKRDRKKHFKDKYLNRFLIVLVASIAISAFFHFYFVGGELGAYIMAFKYDFFGFMIFLVGVHSGFLLEKEQRNHLIDWYITVIKYCLLLSLLWYMIIFIKPGTLKLFGYDNFVYEGLVGSAPPAAYYTQINRGLPRNQFLFERPITRGFLLTALWPLFYIKCLYKKPLQETRLWRSIYAINVLVTFSRAAWGSWIILVIAMFVLMTKNWKRSLIRIGVPLIGLFAAVAILGFDQIMDRGYSNYGHLSMLADGREMFVQSPLRGNGGATAGPGSHRGGVPFNPENQFLQIMIEFGLIGFVGRGFLFASLCIAGLLARISKERSKETKLLLAVSVGMIGLGISGMVLHSFSDRMVVYPFMILFGLIVASYLRQDFSNE